MIKTNDTFNNTEVIIEHGELTLKAAKELSDFVASLNLSYVDNDKLIHLMREQLEVAEREQFLKGADLGLKLGKEFKKIKSVRSK